MRDIGVRVWEDYLSCTWVTKYSFSKIQFRPGLLAENQKCNNKSSVQICGYILVGKF